MSLRTLNQCLPPFHRRSLNSLTTKKNAIMPGAELPKYINEFNQEEQIWGNRKMIAISKSAQRMGELASRSTVSVLNYNVLRQKDATLKKRPYVSEEYLHVTKRRTTLLKEIFSYDADVLCLQVGLSARTFPVQYFIYNKLAGN